MVNVNDTVLVSLYNELGNVWKVGQITGLTGQYVHDRLKELGALKKMNLWTSIDDDVLREKYISHKMANTLDDLAKELGRTKQFICRKARALGLTDRHNTVMAASARKKISENTKRYIREKGHPRGYLGHKHGEETRKKLSVVSRKSWKDPNSIVNTNAFRQKMSDNMHNLRTKGAIKSYSCCGDHKKFIKGKEYVFKSSWEVEIAERLQVMLEKHLICNWEYESMHFEFQDMKRGVRSYCPDFEVTLLNGAHLYIEVKGWEMPASMKRIQMFREHYPNVKFYLINGEEYDKILSESDYLWRRCIEI